MPFSFGFIYLLFIFRITAISDSIRLDLLGFTSSIYFDLLGWIPQLNRERERVRLVRLDIISDYENIIIESATI